MSEELFDLSSSFAISLIFERYYLTDLPEVCTASSGILSQALSFMNAERNEILFSSEGPSSGRYSLNDKLLSVVINYWWYYSLFLLHRTSLTFSISSNRMTNSTSRRETCECTTGVSQFGPIIEVVRIRTCCLNQL